MQVAGALVGCPPVVGRCDETVDRLIALDRDLSQKDLLAF